MDHCAGCRPAVLDRHFEGIGDEVGVLDGIDRPTDDPAAEGVQDSAADLSFARGMFRDVRDP